MPLPLVEFSLADGIDQIEAEALLRSIPPSQANSLSSGADLGSATSGSLGATTVGLTTKGKKGSTKPKKNSKLASISESSSEADVWRSTDNEGEKGDGYERMTFAASGKAASSSAAPGAGGSTLMGLHDGPADCGAGPSAAGIYTNTEFAQLLNRIQHGDTSAQLKLSREGLKQMPPSAVHIVKHGKPLKWRFYANLAPDITVILCSACLHFFTEEDFALSVMQNARCPFCSTGIENLDEGIKKQYMFGADDDEDIGYQVMKKIDAMNQREKQKDAEDKAKLEQSRLGQSQYVSPQSAFANTSQSMAETTAGLTATTLAVTTAPGGKKGKKKMGGQTGTGTVWKLQTFGGNT